MWRWCWPERRRWPGRGKVLRGAVRQRRPAGRLWASSSSAADWPARRWPRPEYLRCRWWPQKSDCQRKNSVRGLLFLSYNTFHQNYFIDPQGEIAYFMWQHDEEVWLTLPCSCYLAEQMIHMRVTCLRRRSFPPHRELSPRWRRLLCRGTLEPKEPESRWQTPPPWSRRSTTQSWSCRGNRDQQTEI